MPILSLRTHPSAKALVAKAGAAAAMLLAVGTLASPAWAEYPEKNISYIVQSGVGGGSDILARTLAKILVEGKLIPVNVLVENRAGGAGAIAYSFINQQKGDPYFLGGVGVSFFTTPLLNKSPVNYKSFTPVAAIARSPYILAVKADSPIKTIEDLKKQQGLRAGTGAAVSDPTLLANLTAQKMNIKIRVVPFDGEGEVLSALLGGHIDLIYGNPNEILEQVKSGQLRPIAVTSAERMTSLPDVPTFKELGYAITHPQLRGIIMPPGVPPETVRYWEDVLRKVAESPAWRTQYVDRFNEIPGFLNSEEFARQMVETNTLYETLMTELKLIK